MVQALLVKRHKDLPCATKLRLFSVRVRQPPWNFSAQPPVILAQAHGAKLAGNNTRRSQIYNSPLNPGPALWIPRFPQAGALPHSASRLRPACKQNKLWCWMKSVISCNLRINSLTRPAFRRSRFAPREREREDGAPATFQRGEWNTVTRAH